jgi:RNA polymerase sigma-70 factor (ECF subfamily)
MRTRRLPDAAVRRLYGRARAEHWDVPFETFAGALERSAQHAASGDLDAHALEAFLQSLHLEDLALACACAAGHEGAWEHFIRHYRPALYRAADAIDPSGNAREAADSMYGELFGLSERDGERRSLFHYFHGRSSMATWLRAVLAQRHVDRVRSVRRFESLPEDEALDTTRARAPGTLPTPSPGADPARPGYLAAIRRAVTAVVASLTPRDRLRLACYYAQDLTLAQIGLALGEHEATVSRHLARARREIRHGVERHLREHEHMSEEAVAECFSSVVEDAGSLDISEMLGTSKESGKPRSKERRERANA